MNLCDCCVTKECVKTGKPCAEIEAILKADKIYSRDYIRKRPTEIPMEIEALDAESQNHLKNGKRKSPTRIEDYE